MAAVSLPVEAVAGVTGAHHPSKVIGALLLTGRRCTHVHACRETENIKHSTHPCLDLRKQHSTDLDCN